MYTLKINSKRIYTKNNGKQAENTDDGDMKVDGPDIHPHQNTN